MKGYGDSRRSFYIFWDFGVSFVFMRDAQALV